MRLVLSARPEFQKSLNEWMPANDSSGARSFPEVLNMPRNINWNTMKKVYEFRPANYEEFLGFRGVGPATVRGLALVAELIYGEKPSWKDPVKYSFAYGGKDGVPFPVDRQASDASISLLRATIKASRIR